MESNNQMNEDHPPERQLSNIVPTNPYAGFPTTAHSEPLMAAQPGEPIQQLDLNELFSMLAAKSFNDVGDEIAKQMSEAGIEDKQPCISFSESVAETRSMLTNVVAYIDKGHFDRAASGLASAVYSMFVLGNILDQETGGKFGTGLALKFQNKEEGCE